MSHCDVGAASPPMPAAPAYDGHASEQKERSSMRSHWPNHEHGSWQITPDAHDMNCKTRKPGCAKQYMSTLDAFAVKADRPSETSPFDDSQADAETQARRSHKLPAPLCSCGCRRRIYESYLRRGDSSNIGRAPRQDRTVRGPPRRSATHRPRRTAGIVAAARRSRPAGRPWVRTATQGPRSAGGLDRGDPTRAARSSWHAPPPKVVRRSRPPLRAKVDKRGLRGGMSEPREDRIPRSHATTLPGDTCTLRVMSRSRAAASALASHRRLATAPWRR